jgi:hypothetical protein
MLSITYVAGCKPAMKLFAATRFTRAMGMVAFVIAALPLLAGAQDFQSAAFRSDRYEYELKSAALREGNLWLAVGLRPKGNLGGAQQYQLWQLDPQRKKRMQVDLGSIAIEKQGGDACRKVYDLAITRSGDLAALVESESGKLALLVFSSSTNELIVNRAVRTSRRDLFFNKLRTTADGDLLAIGRTGDEAFLLKLRPNGEIAAETIVHDKELAIALDVVEINDTYVLAGAHLKPTGESNLWIGRVNAKGDVLSRTVFAGRLGSLVYDDDTRKLAVIYEVVGTKGWNVFVRGLDEGLATTWESQLMTESPTMLPFQMAAIPGGGLLVAGSTSRRLLWFSRLAKGGEKQWTQEHFEPDALWQGVWNYQVLTSAQESVLAFTELLVGEEKEQRQIVKVLTLKPK